MNRIGREELEKMLDMAEEAMHHAYTPYSNFQVGACLRTSDGEYYLGCNIENATYTPTICAERTAFFKAVYDGERAFSAIAVIGTGDLPAFPCGVCRQVMAEFCDADFVIITANRDLSTVVVKTLDEMLPERFGPKDLL